MEKVFNRSVSIPDHIKYIIDRLEACGHEAYAVGGCVRDSLRGGVPSDWDMCTSALPKEVMEIFSDIKIIPTGIKHGTVTLVVPVSDEDTDRFLNPEERLSMDLPQGFSRRLYSENNINGKVSGLKLRDIFSESQGYDINVRSIANVEITTFRTDGSYTDGRHPDSVKFVRSIEEDLARRDFTVNAMAYSPSSGLIDMFGGREDLANGVLRCVGDPKERFGEDALRILRALRFMSEKGFSADPDTEAAVRSCRESLKDVSAERISSEFIKFLCGSRAAELLDEYREVFACIIPELAQTFNFDQKSPHHNRDVWHHILCAVNDIPPVPYYRMTMLLHDIAKPVVFILDDNGRGRFVGHPEKGAQMVEKILRRLRFPADFVNRIVSLVRYHDAKIKPTRSEVRKWLCLLGSDVFFDLMFVRHADAAGKYDKYIGEADEKNKMLADSAESILKDGDCISLKQLDLNGKDLLSAGFAEGRKIGEILEKLLNEVMEDRLPNEKTALLEAAEKELYGIRERE